MNEYFLLAVLTLDATVRLAVRAVIHPLNEDGLVRLFQTHIGYQFGFRWTVRANQEFVSGF